MPREVKSLVNVERVILFSGFHIISAHYVLVMLYNTEVERREKFRCHLICNDVTMVSTVTKYVTVANFMPSFFPLLAA